jgi:hypothetical protein
VSVERCHVQAVAPGGEAAVDGVAAKGQVFRQRLLIVPELRAGLAVDGVGVIPRRRDVHDAVDDQRGAFKAVEDSGLEAPDGDQLVDVLLVDLGQRAVALGVVGAAVHQPVGVVASGVEQVLFLDGADGLGLLLFLFLGGDLGRRCAAEEQDEQQQRQPSQPPSQTGERPGQRVQLAHGWCLPSISGASRG